MRYFKSYLIVLTLVLSIPGYGQLFDQPERKFQEGLSFYKLGRYDMAIQKFGDITSNNANDTYAPLAHYYYALSANKIKKYNDSNLMLRQLLSRYATWPQRDEAYYLIANNYFELKDPRRAFDFLRRIGDARIGKDVQGMKQHYLQDVQDVNLLKTLNTEYPNDRVVATNLVNLIQSKPSNKADLELSDRLTNQYNIGHNAGTSASQPAKKSPQKTTPAYEKRWTKGYYNVAVLFPYRLYDFDLKQRTTSNQFAFDYFEGMLLARQQLKSEGVQINLQAYDLSNEEDKVMEMVNNSYFQQSDLIFGPLYARPFELVVDFANVNNITVVNPLATDSRLLENGKLVYLAHPSIQRQTQEIVSLIKSRGGNPVAAIYYGGNTKDSVMALTYREELLKAGGKVLEMKAIRGGADDMNSQISGFTGQKPNHVVLFSTDSKSGPALMNVLAGRDLQSIPVVAIANSFNFNQRRPSGYGGNLYLLDHDYVDLNKESIKKFQVDYFEKTNTLPSVYSYQGYDQLLFFGRMIGKHSERVKDGIELRRYNDDYLLYGFDYTKSRENSVSSLLTYRDARWIPWEGDR